MLRTGLMFRKSEEKNSELQENLEKVNQENLNLHQKLETSLKETLALVEEKAALLTGNFPPKYLSCSQNLGISLV